MDYIHVRIMDKVAIVMIGLEGLAELLPAEFNCTLEVIRIRIADRHKPAPLIAGEVIAGLAYPSDTDYAFRQLVTRGYIAFVAVHRTEDISRQYREKSHACAGLFQKTSSAFVHYDKN